MTGIGKSGWNYRKRKKGVRLPPGPRTCRTPCERAPGTPGIADLPPRIHPLLQVVTLGSCPLLVPKVVALGTVLAPAATFEALRAEVVLLVLRSPCCERKPRSVI